jgi:hypothetical protein
MSVVKRRGLRKEVVKEDQAGASRTPPESTQADRLTLGTAVIRNRTSGGVRGSK